VDMEGNAPSRTCLQGTAPAFRTRPWSGLRESNPREPRSRRGGQPLTQTQLWVCDGTRTRLALVHSEWTRLFVLAHSPRVRNRTCVSRSSGESSAIELRVVGWSARQDLNLRQPGSGPGTLPD
jgi:hypothetical protein